MENSEKISFKRLTVEGVVIIVSILLAFAIDAWYARAIEQRVAADYEERISIELAKLRENLDRQARSIERALEYARIAEPFFEGSYETIDKDRLIVALYNMGREYTNRFDLSTYQELVSSGQLGLISDSAKRAAVQYTYELMPRYEENRFPYMDEYTLGVRGLIPTRIASRILQTDGCANMADVEWDCESVSFNDISTDVVLDRMVPEEAYKAFRARMQGLFIVQRRTEYIAGEVDKALALFD